MGTACEVSRGRVAVAVAVAVAWARSLTRDGSDDVAKAFGRTRGEEVEVEVEVDEEDEEEEGRLWRRIVLLRCVLFRFGSLRSAVDLLNSFSRVTDSSP